MTHGTFSVAQISLIGTLGIRTSIFGRVMCVEGQTALVRPFRGEFDMLPKWPPIRAGPLALSALLGRPFGEHIEFPPKHPNHSLTAAIISKYGGWYFQYPL